MISAGEPDWSADMMVALFDDCRGERAAGVTDTLEPVTGRPPISFADFAPDFASAFIKED